MLYLYQNLFTVKGVYTMEFIEVPKNENDDFSDNNNRSKYHVFQVILWISLLMI